MIFKVFEYYNLFQNVKNMRILVSQKQAMKNIYQLFAVFLFSVLLSQSSHVVSKSETQFPGTTQFARVNPNRPDLISLYGDVPLLIPKRENGKVGYVNQKGQMIIPAEFYIAMFFAEDCNLLNSPNESVRKYGSNEYATVEKDQISYRIDVYGKKVYRYKDSDLGKCKNTYIKQKYGVYKDKYLFELRDNHLYKNSKVTFKFQIPPQYEMLYVLEGNDLENPMIVAVANNKFGVINKDNKTIIPFEYEDIKLNYSWKLGGMFEVTKDGKNYYYVDVRNKKY